jgi:hypothetical protein
VVVHVEDEVLAHHGQTDKGDVSLWFHIRIQFKFETSTIQKPAPSASSFMMKKIPVSHEKMQSFPDRRSPLRLIKGDLV